MDPNDLLRNMLRGFFGFPRHQKDGFLSDHFSFNDGHNRGAGDDEDGDNNRDNNHESNSRGFTVYTDPLELHKYFDQQVNDMIKMFGFGGLGSAEGLREGFGIYSTPPQDRMLPHGGDQDKSSAPGDRARDFMLRGEPGQPKVDTEVDWDKLDWEELDRLMTHDREDDRSYQPQRHFKNTMMDLIPDKKGSCQSPGGVFSLKSFGSSMSERSVTTPNGGLETSRTVRNSDGSEEVTVTKRLGDQSHQQVIRRDKYGNAAEEEKLVNIQEKDLENFKRKFESNSYKSCRILHDPRQEMIQGPPTDSTYLKLWNKFFGN